MISLLFITSSPVMSSMLWLLPELLAPNTGNGELNWIIGHDQFADNLAINEFRYGKFSDHVVMLVPDDKQRIARLFDYAFRVVKAGASVLLRWYSESADEFEVFDAGKRKAIGVELGSSQGRGLI